MNKKALFIFLGLTFGITLILVLIARAMGLTLTGTNLMYSQLVVLGAMFVPALSAVITHITVLKKPLRSFGFNLGPPMWYIYTYLAILGMYLIQYGITWLLILPPDFTLTSFMQEYAIQGGLPIPGWQMILAFVFMTLFTAPLVNLIPSLGEELGWRGFLMPVLEPMGRRKAVLVSGMIWAFWHTPMIIFLGFGYGDQVWPGVLLHFAMVTGLGIWMGYIWLETRSVLLAGFIHAAFNAHAYGIWAMLFVSPNKVLVGAGSVVGAVLWVLMGAGTLWYMYRKRLERAEVVESGIE